MANSFARLSSLASSFLQSREVWSLALVGPSSWESFQQGHFGLHVRIETNQLSRLFGSRRPRREILTDLVAALGRFAKPPLLSLRLHEPRTFRELFPLVLEVLRNSSNLEVLHLHDVYIDPIRAAGADGDFNEEVATRLVESFDFRGQRRPGRALKELALTAGSWSWESLCLLFQCLSESSTLKRLNLRGKLHLPQVPAEPAQHLTALELGSVQSFEWQGSNIYNGAFMESLLRALPQAHVRFRMESSGAWSGPSALEVQIFRERLRSVQRDIKVHLWSRDGEHQRFADAWTDLGKPMNSERGLRSGSYELRAMMNFEVEKGTLQRS